MFRLILDEMLVTTRGAMAALFVDYEGETVELVCDRDLSDHDLRVVGAYQNVLLSRLRKVCSATAGGEPQRFKIDFTGLRILSYDVKDGYYVVLLTDHNANEGLAWRQLAECREKLIKEM